MCTKTTGIAWDARVRVADLPESIAAKLEESWEFGGIESMTTLPLEEVFDTVLEWEGIIGYTEMVKDLAQVAARAGE